MGLHCVNCGSPVIALYIQYSPGNIRLTKCAKCKAVADEYIECEMMILLIDLILHKTKAYRHLFFNMPHLNKYELQGLVWKAALLFLLLDACIQKMSGCLYFFCNYSSIVLQRSALFVVSKPSTFKGRQLVLDPSKMHSELSRSPASLLVAVGKLMFSIVLSNIVFFSTLLLATKSFRNKQETSQTRNMEICMAVLFSSYFKIFMTVMMVWYFPSSAVFIIDVFVLSSNAVAVNVVTNATTFKSVGVSFIGHFAKFLLDYMNCRSGLLRMHL